MNVRIVHKANVKDSTLDGLAKELPTIISGVMEVPGGNMALLKPEQISLEFSPACSRDIGADIRIMAFARRNAPRISTDNVRAREILEKVGTSIAKSGDGHSVDVRLYLMEIGSAFSTP